MFYGFYEWQLLCLPSNVAAVAAAVPAATVVVCWSVIEGRAKHDAHCPLPPPQQQTSLSPFSIFIFLHFSFFSYRFPNPVSLFFSRVHATLKPAWSVGPSVRHWRSVSPSVRRSVCQTFLFLLFLIILSHLRLFLVILSHSKSFLVVLSHCKSF